MRKLIVLTVFFLNLYGVWAETSLSAARSPKKVVTDLYSAHKGKADPLQYPASKKLSGAYFEKGLMSLFLKTNRNLKVRLENKLISSILMGELSRQF